MITLVIADDHPVVRAGLRAVFDGDLALRVIAETANADDAVTIAKTHRPDVVTMDLRFGEGTSGAEATRRLRALPEPPAVLVVTNYDNDADILDAIEAGASGYLLKDAPPEDLLRAVRDAAAGKSVLAPAVADRIRRRAEGATFSLTSREREVLELVGEGLTNAQIGQHLHLSLPTVKSHLAHVFGKLGVSNRTAALARAREAGILR